MVSDEILGYILDLACQDSFDERERVQKNGSIFEHYSNMGPEYLYPVWLSQVCRNWRAVALSTADLWAHITLSSQHTVSMAMAFRERSRTTSLNIQVQEKPWSWSLLSELRMCAPQASHMAVKANYAFMFDLFRALDDIPATRLEKLTIMLDGVEESAVSADALWLSSFHRIFAREAPELKYVSIMTLPISWRAPILCGGTLARLAIWRQYIPDVTDVLETLRANPLLEEVTFGVWDQQRDVVRTIEEWHPDTQRVLLPCLRRLKLINVKFNYSKFLAHLSTPADIRVDHDCVDWGMNNRGSDGLGLFELLLRPYTALQAHLPAFRTENILSLYFDQSTYRSRYSVSCFPSIHDLNVGGKEAHDAARLHISIRMEDEWNDQIFELLASDMLPNLRVMRADGVNWLSDEPTGPNAWQEVFENCPNLHMLILDGCDLGCALPPLAGAVQRSWQLSVRCPRLEGLTVLIRPRNDLCENDIATLLACAQSRKLLGVPLKFVALKRSPYHDGWRQFNYDPDGWDHGRKRFTSDTQTSLLKVNRRMEVAVGPRVRKVGDRELLPDESWLWGAGFE